MSKQLFDKFASLKSATFIGINGYKNQENEVSNQTINVNVDLFKAKKSDLKTLQAITEEQLRQIALDVNVDFATAQKALNELIDSFSRNLTSDNKTQASEAQSDAYISLGNGLRLHKESLEVYISGFANTKKVIVEGNYKPVNKQAKTLVKDEIKKSLKTTKFRNFRLGKIDTLSVTGDTIIIR